MRAWMVGAAMLLWGGSAQAQGAHKTVVVFADAAPQMKLVIGGLWLAFFLSGVHPTIAGVLAAFTIPARTRLSGEEFITRGRALLPDTVVWRARKEGS